MAEVWRAEVLRVGVQQLPGLQPTKQQGCSAATAMDPCMDFNPTMEEKQGIRLLKVHN